MTIRHVVLWKLKETDPAAKADQGRKIREHFEALKATIPEIRSLQVGVNVLPVDYNWDVSLIIDFADLFALETYQQHPDHLKAAAYVGSLTSDRSAVDFQVH